MNQKPEISISLQAVAMLILDNQVSDLWARLARKQRGVRDLKLEVAAIEGQIRVLREAIQKIKEA